MQHYAIDTKGLVWSWGHNNYGQLGHGDTVDRSSFSQINLDDEVIDIAAGYGENGSCAAITGSGDLYVWGGNDYGKLGTGDIYCKESPYKPEGQFQGKVTKVVVIDEAIILQAGNELWAAGYGGVGNIGIGAAIALNLTFKRVLGQSGDIEDWGAFGQGMISWGLGVLYDDGRVDACGKNNSYGETGTQAGRLHDVLILTNVIF